MQKNEIQQMFAQYWAAKLAIQLAFPEITPQSLDTIAKAMMADKPKGLLGPAPSTRPIVVQEAQNTPRHWYPIKNLLKEIVPVGEFMPLKTIYERAVEKGWPYQQYGNPYCVLKSALKTRTFEMGRRDEFRLRRVGPPEQEQEPQGKQDIRGKQDLRRAQLEKAVLQLLREEGVLSPVGIREKITTKKLFDFGRYKDPDNALSKMLRVSKHIVRCGAGKYKLKT